VGAVVTKRRITDGLPDLLVALAVQLVTALPWCVMRRGR